jgi:HD-GYP domain-containing protein (c-di-GMP phosphodiesterase class II)
MDEQEYGGSDRRVLMPEHAQCAVCGARSADRQYHLAEERVTCEHCLLDSRKALAGLLDVHPYEEFAESFAAALDLRERATGLHSKRVASHTLILARQHYSDAATLREIYWGSLLHDIGKIGVPDAILLKPDRLTPEEWTEMRKHPQIGHSILRSIDFLGVPAEIVLCHQERYDGRGYPRGLAGDAIPIGARIFAVADTFDAMTNDRPYRKGQGVEAARAEIARYAGTQFDPRAAEAFLSMSEREIIEVARPSPKPPV